METNGDPRRCDNCDYVHEFKNAKGEPRLQCRYELKLICVTSEPRLVKTGKFNLKLGQEETTMVQKHNHASTFPETQAEWRCAHYAPKIEAIEH